MAKSLSQLVILVLKSNPEKIFTARDLAEHLWENHKEEFKEKRENPRFETDDDLVKQITAEIGAQKKAILRDKKVKIQDQVRPKKYSYSEDEAKEGSVETFVEIENEELKEKDLYPLLSEYLFIEFEISSKRIDEKKSINDRGSGGNMWLHPDVVGIETLDSNWNALIKGCVKGSGANKIKVYSYEVKRTINRRNLRESFFQAVSNSSWANQGYLVSADLDDQVFNELKMLASLHGIGFILLNTDNPSESQILLQAKEKETVDWASANRLVEQNSDFKDFIQAVKVYYDSDVINKNDWWRPT